MFAFQSSQPSKYFVSLLEKDFGLVRNAIFKRHDPALATKSTNPIIN